jgi:hypothetical protein
LEVCELLQRALRLDEASTPEASSARIAFVRSGVPGLALGVLGLDACAGDRLRPCDHGEQRG